MFAVDKDGVLLLDARSEQVSCPADLGCNGIFRCQCGREYLLRRDGDSLVVPPDWEVVSDGHFQCDTVFTPCGHSITVVDELMNNPFPTMEDGGDG